VDAMQEPPTPPPAAPSAGAPRAGSDEPPVVVSAPLVPKDISIPVVIEPTADLRVKPGEIDSAPMSLRVRPAKPAVVEEPTGFPRPLAIGLAVLAILVAAIGLRFWLAGPTAPAEQEAVTSVTADAAGVTYDALPAGAAVPSGQGLLTVIVAEGVPVRIDGNEDNEPRKGKTLHMTLPPGVHLVSVGAGEKARSRILEVRKGLATNVNLDGP
jgi:hypothetical protein